MRFHLPDLTPNHLKLGARASLGPLAGIIWLGLVAARMTHLQLAVALFFLAAALLMAAPRTRNSELLCLLGVAVTLGESVMGHLAGGMNLQRWLNFMGLLGAITLILKVQHWRSLARNDGYVSLRLLERRKFFSIGRPQVPMAKAKAKPRLDHTAGESDDLAERKTKSQTVLPQRERRP